MPTLVISATGRRDGTATAALVLPGFISLIGHAELRLPAITAAARATRVVSNAYAYVLNLNTTETSVYTNMSFMHIIAISGKFYGVRADGLYLLEGADDEGVAINGTITLKETDFGKFQSKRVPYIYLNSDTRTHITPFVDTVQGPSCYSQFGGRKAKPARGLEGRYWKIKIENIINLQGLEILPEPLQRRVN
jgi:hypothetical protein